GRSTSPGDPRIRAARRARATPRIRAARRARATRQTPRGRRRLRAALEVKQRELRADSAGARAALGGLRVDLADPRHRGPEQLGDLGEALLVELEGLGCDQAGRAV